MKILLIVFCFSLLLLMSAAHIKPATGVLITDAPCWQVHTQGECTKNGEGLHVIVTTGRGRPTSQGMMYEYREAKTGRWVQLVGEFKAVWRPKDEG